MIPTLATSSASAVLDATTVVLDDRLLVEELLVGIPKDQVVPPRCHLASRGTPHRAHMARIASRHPRLNLLNLEAVAVGQLFGATLWLSPETTRGVLPSVLDQEHVAWQAVITD